MEELRGASAIDTIQRPILPPLPPAILAIRNPDASRTAVAELVEPEVVDEVPILHEDVGVFGAVDVVVAEAPPHAETTLLVAEPEPLLADPAEAPVEEADVEEADTGRKLPKPQGLELDNKKLLIGLFAVFVVVLAVAGMRVAGVLSSAALVTDLEAGDCIEDFFTPNEGEFRQIFVVGTTGCANPHAYEVYAVGESVYDELAYPGVEGVFAVAQTYCNEQYSSFVGGDFLSSPWNVWTFAPTEDRWNAGEREVQCIVGDFDQTNLISGSLKDAGR